MSDIDLNNTHLLEDFNSAESELAKTLVLGWCAAPDWAARLCDARPFATLDDLINTACELWNHCSEADNLAAFSSHPLIGDVALLRKKYATQANAEQGQVLEADEQVLHQLAIQNAAYSKRHGFTFIVFATGKSAAEMLDLLNARIGNSRAEELANARVEQEKIMLLRLRQTFAGTSTTHVSNNR